VLRAVCSRARGLVLLRSRRTRQLDDTISGSSGKALQVQHSHQGAFSTVFRDAPRRRADFTGPSAGDGGGRASALCQAVRGCEKQGCDLCCSFNVHVIKSDLRKPAVPFGLTSKYLNVKNVKGKKKMDGSVLPEFSFHLQLLMEGERSPCPFPGRHRASFRHFAAQLLGVLG